MVESQQPEEFPETEPARDEESFREIAPPAGEGPDQAPADTATCALVLAARGIPYRQHSQPPRVEVPTDYLRAASRELDLFASENRNWPPVETATPAAPQVADNSYATLSVLALLAFFHILVHGGMQALGLPAFDWMGRGSAAAGRILAGEWWRPLTALTLHADGLHLLSNLLIGAPLVVPLCRRLGGGLGWFLILATGVLGNLTNALIQNPAHDSIGFSTALFGALGLLAGLGLIHGRIRRLRRWALPLAAALALLALLGTGEGNVDVEAHLFGFSWGVLLGWEVGREIVRLGEPTAARQRWFAALAALLPLAAWWAALATG